MVGEGTGATIDSGGTKNPNTGKKCQQGKMSTLEHERAKIPALLPLAIKGVMGLHAFKHYYEQRAIEIWNPHGMHYFGNLGTGGVLCGSSGRHLVTAQSWASIDL